jgi:hypothetical protein
MRTSRPVAGLRRPIIHVRRLVVAAAAGALLVPTLLVGTALAGGVSGSPQPDAKQFVVGTDASANSSAVLSDGSLVVAYDVGNTTRVCRILRSGRKCTSLAKLTPLAVDADDDFSTPQVFAPSAHTVVVLQSTCCATDADGTLLYTSTDFGKTFDAGVRVGSIGTDAATMVGGNIVFTAQDDHVGLEVQSTPATGATGVPMASATVESSAAAYDVGLGNVKGGVILGVDDLLSGGYSTTIRYAASGLNPGLAASYGVIGTFPGERLVAINGDAVLTVGEDSKSTLKLRMFNGTKFTAPSAVPGGKGGGPEWFALDVDPSGLAHVFVVTSRHSYDIFQVTTRDDVHWSAADFIGDAVADDYFSAAVDKAGTGIAVGTATATIYPILAPQSVTVALSKTTIALGATTTLSGKVSPKIAARPVQLQYEKSGKWYTEATVAEKATGKFAFTITGATAGSTVYRAVVVGVAGHYLYGYSKSVTVKVT